MYKFLLLIILLFCFTTTILCDAWENGGSIVGLGINEDNHFYPIIETEGACDNFTDCIEKMCNMSQLTNVYWPVIKFFTPNCTCPSIKYSTEKYEGINDGGIVMGIADPYAPIYNSMTMCISTNDCAQKMINVFCNCNYKNLMWVGIQFFNDTNCNQFF